MSRFCEKVYALVEEKIRAATPPNSHINSPRVLLLNAYGNTHSLGIRILALWLNSEGFDARSFYPTPYSKDLADIIGTISPKAVLISMSISAQRQGVLRIINTINSVPDLKPIIVIGGYAIKMEVVDPIPGAIALSDFAKLPAVIHGFSALTSSRVLEYQTSSAY
jgi:methanogenic corrinoid protein MtbC1